MMASMSTSLTFALPRGHVAADLLRALLDDFDQRDPRVAPVVRAAVQWRRGVLAVRCRLFPFQRALRAVPVTRDAVLSEQLLAAREYLRVTLGRTVGLLAIGG